MAGFDDGAPFRRPGTGSCESCRARKSVGPAGTSSAAVMRVPGSASDFRLSHGAAANTLPAITKAMLIMVSYRYGLKFRAR